MLLMSSCVQNSPLQQGVHYLTQRVIFKVEKSSLDRGKVLESNSKAGAVEESQWVRRCAGQAEDLYLIPSASIKCWLWPHLSTTPELPRVEARGSSGLADFHPSFRSNRRPYLKRIIQKVIRKDTQCPPLLPMCTHANTHIHSHSVMV